MMEYVAVTQMKNSGKNTVAGILREKESGDPCG
jgi:dephospho-CoA kinase